MKEMFKLNILVFKKCWKSILLNTSIWICISLIPLITGLIYNYYLADLNDGGNLYVYFSIVFLGVGLLHFCFIKAGGKYETRNSFIITEMIRRNILNEIIKNKTLKGNNGKYVDIIENDSETPATIISIECDIICRIIFYVFAMIILMYIDIGLTIFQLVLLLLLTGSVFIFGERIKGKHKSYRESGMKYMDELDAYIQSGILIRQLDLKNNFKNHLYTIAKETSWKTFKKNTFERIINESYSYVDSVLIVMMLSYIIVFNLNLSVAQISLFISYFSYGCTIFGLFSELFQNYKYLENEVQNLSKLFHKKNAEITHILMLNKNETIKKDADKILLNAIDENGNVNEIHISSTDKVLVIADDDAILNDFADSILGYKKDSATPIKKYDSKGNEIQNCKIGYIENKDYIFVDYQSGSVELNTFNLQNISKTIELNGSNMSEGEKQRLAIIQALKQNTNILLLNNCFSTIDEDTVKKIHAYIASLNRGIIKLSLKEDSYLKYNMILKICKNELMIKQS